MRHPQAAVTAAVISVFTVGGVYERARCYGCAPVPKLTSGLCLFLVWLVAYNMAPTTKKVRIKIMSRKKLGSTCSALGCNLTSGTNTLSKIKMYRYPKDEDRRRAWLTAVQRDGEGLQTRKNLRLCSNHFITGAPSADPWNPDYVPSIFAHKTTADGSQKLEQKQMRQKKKSVVKSNDSPSLEVSHTDPNKQCTAADLSMADIDRLQKENTELKRKVAVLEKTLKSQENDYKIVCWAVCPNCFCVFQPRPLPDDKVESIIDHPCHSRAVSCGPGEASSRLK